MIFPEAPETGADEFRQLRKSENFFRPSVLTFPLKQLNGNSTTVLCPERTKSTSIVGRRSRKIKPDSSAAVTLPS